jgi:hypothetical protein
MFKQWEFFMTRICARLAFALMWAAMYPLSASAELVASDDFETNTLSKGTGTEWSTAWNTSGGNYISGASKIDGTYSLGLYGGASASRLVNASITTTAAAVELKFSFRADWDVVNPGFGFSGSEIGVTIRNASSQPLFTYKFNQGNSQLRLNDGGGDFSPGTSLTFARNDIYDFTFESAIGSNQYSFQVSRRGNSETASGTNFTYSAGRTTNSIGGINFFVNAPSGSGNDGFLDGVSISAVPEVSPMLAIPAALAIAGAVSFGWRRWRAKPAVEVA